MLLVVNSIFYRGTSISVIAAMLMLTLILQHCALLLAHAMVVAEKRAGLSGGSSSGSSSIVGPGQPEEIFTLDNRLESNYDEYPMVVPKRAALLLDRLMVALHHALEKERRKIGDFYDEIMQSNGNKQAFNQQRLKDKSTNNNNNNHDYDNIGDENGGGGGGVGVGGGGVGVGGGAGNLMYSDDDPNVLLDYDFKDLNSINRATGQTLANNFQRRGHGGGGAAAAFLESGDGLALLHAPIAGVPVADVSAADTGFIAAAITKLHDDTTAGMIGDVGGLDASSGGIGGGGRNNLGRMYWRCYFNAVSCF